jgi:hypothetical protein
MRLGTADVLVRAKTGQYTKDIGDAENTTKRFGKNATASIGKISTSLTALAGTIGTGVLMNLVNNSIDATAEMDRLATMAGVTTESFQELSYAAGQYQITQDALTDGLKELSLRGDEFVVTGAGPAKEAFERLGYSADELNGMLDDTPALLSDIISRMEGLDKAAQIRIADELFGGTGGEQFVSMVQGGAKALDEMRKSARNLGIVIDDDLVDQSIEAQKRIQTLTTVLSSRFNQTVALLAPDIEMLAMHTLDWVSANKDLIDQNTDQAIGAISTAASGLYGTLSSFKSLYDSLPVEISGAHGVGIVGGVLFGGSAGKIVATVSLIDSQMSAMGNGLSDLVRKHKESGEAIKQLWDSIKAEFEDGVDTVTMPIVGSYTPGLPASENVSNVSPKSPSLSAAPASTKALSSEVNSLIDARLEGWFNDVDLAAAEYNMLMAEGARVTLSMRTPTEQLADVTDNLTMLFDAGAISAETYGRAIARAEEEIKGSAVDADLKSFFGDIDAESEKLAQKTTTDWDNAFSGWATSYSSVLNDMLWGSEATFEGILKSFGKMITQMIIQQSMLSMFGGGGGGWMMAIGNAIASLFHTGGVVGSGDGGGRAVSPTVFAGAPRYHTGLMPDEVPAILKKGEGVFTQAQMSAIGGALGSSGSNVEVHIHNATGVKKQTETKTNNGQRLDIWLEDQMAKTAGGSNSFTSVLESKYGLRTGLVGR